MRRRSVVFKLFAVTSVLILVVFSLVMLAEGLFFERFYRSSKLGALEHGMDQFARQFEQTEGAVALGQLFVKNGTPAQTFEIIGQRLITGVRSVMLEDHPGGALLAYVTFSYLFDPYGNKSGTHAGKWRMENLGRRLRNHNSKQQTAAGK
ncbi:hypothetical protein [Paenibacillus sp. VMFN-D1]|uniref:hypothetical protein n=1 Tax=Paenibacillus sp. VMFN-D1 TaxID=2135608 RepID=UPI000E3AB678|nr:hypothetical protein [Paenibacillus sp. VMFN-D1]RED37403.1 hypothetical protein C7820_4207 [Paenibacillus sp. VMFN-D1]